MKRVLLFLTFLISLMTISTSAKGDDLTINIKIKSSSEGYDLTSEDGFELVTEGKTVLPIPSKNIHLYYENGLMIKTDSGFYGPYENSMVASKNNITAVGNRKYNGSFYLDTVNKALINNVSLEEYIYSVVSSEMGSSFEMDALKSQAVAARSYAISNLKKYIKHGYNLTNDIYSQVYLGVNNVNDKIRKAVDETKGLVAFFNGEVINATYSSSNGGVIASSEEVWGNKYPYLVVKSDPYSTNTPNVDWKVEVTRDNLDEILAQKTNKRNFTGLKLQKNGLGRVNNVIVSYNDGDVKLSANKFRLLFGSSKFRSTLFDVNKKVESINAKPMPVKEKTIVVASTPGPNEGVVFDIVKLTDEELNKISKVQNLGISVTNSAEAGGQNIIETAVDLSEKYVFYGKGFGHSVGLSQFGANEMAKQGFKYLDILNFYYPGIEVKVLND